MSGVNKSHYMILFTVQYSMIARCHYNCKLKRHVGPEQCKQVTCVCFCTPTLTGRLVMSGQTRTAMAKIFFFFLQFVISTGVSS